jgi:hypothetical protein
MILKLYCAFFIIKYVQIKQHLMRLFMFEAIKILILFFNMNFLNPITVN